MLLLGATGHDGTTFVSNSRANIQMTASEAWTASTQGTFMRFNTTTSGTTTTSTRMFIADDGNIGIGTTTPNKHLHVAGPSDQEIMLESTDSGGIQWSLQSSRGANNGRFEIIDRTAALSRISILDSGNVGIGTVAPNDKLEVNGIIRVATLGSGNTISLCRNSSNQISNCSSSLRYKTHVATLPSGLSLINRLRPVSFAWKQNHERDLGLIAEEVAKVEPLLTFRNEKGEIEGVKYDRVTVVLLNAVKEQQAQIEQQHAHIERQQAQLVRQQAEIDALKRLVCARHPRSGVCRPRHWNWLLSSSSKSRWTA